MNQKMKVINETFTDEEFKFLTKHKDGHSWHDFLLLMATHCDAAVKKGDLEIYKK